jgi:transposase
MRKRATVSDKEKAKIALEALRNEEPLSAIANRYKVHPIQVGKWRQQLQREAYLAFEAGKGGRRERENEEEVARLYEQIGRLKVENEFLKKKTDS